MPLSRKTPMSSTWRWVGLLLCGCCRSCAPPSAIACCRRPLDAHQWPSPPCVPCLVSLPQPEEALSSAVEEFTAQGVDLSNIIKTLSGGDIGAHPAALAVAALTSAQEAGDADGMVAAAADIAAAVAAARSSAATAAADSEALAVVLHKSEAAQALVGCLPACDAAPAHAALAQVLRALAALLGCGSRELQTDFLQGGGAAAVQLVLDSHASDATLAAAALQAAAASAVRNEASKAALMAAGVGISSLGVMQQHLDQPEALEAACAVLCALTNPDDDTLPSSRWVLPACCAAAYFGLLLPLLLDAAADAGTVSVAVSCCR